MTTVQTRRKSGRTLILALVLAAVSALPVFATLEPSPASQVVAQLVARLFEQTHYNHRPIDEALSRQWLREYLEYFDYNHMIFEKSDVDEFDARYGGRLGDLVRTGTSPRPMRSSINSCSGPKSAKLSRKHSRHHLSPSRATTA
jgi:hypothetical protein